MEPQITINFLAVFGAVVASFFFGFLWHGPLFGKAWVRMMNLPADYAPSSASMMKSIAINLLGTFLMVVVFKNSLDIWRPSAWGYLGVDKSFLYYAHFTGLFVWLGFFVPMLLNTVAWENRGWKLFGFNATYHFLNLQIIGLIIAYWP